MPRGTPRKRGVCGVNSALGGAIRIRPTTRDWSKVIPPLGRENGLDRALGKGGGHCGEYARLVSPNKVFAGWRISLEVATEAGAS
jgi:hypothetical protein